MNSSQAMMYYIHKDYPGFYDANVEYRGTLIEKSGITPPPVGGGWEGALNGRFLSPDPIVQLPDNSQSHNRYSYCLNNPLKYVDPSGYYIEPPVVIDFSGMINLAAVYGPKMMEHFGVNSPGSFNNMGGSYFNYSGTNVVSGTLTTIDPKTGIALETTTVYVEVPALPEEKLDDPPGKEGEEGDVWSHTVKRGQNINGIRLEYYLLFTIEDIRKLNLGVDLYNLFEGQIVKVPGPSETLGVDYFDVPGVPEGKYGGTLQLLFQLLINSPHSPLYFNVKPGQLSQNRVYYNKEIGYYEWSWANDTHSAMIINTYVGYTRWKGTWRGVYLKHSFTIPPFL